jgi:predicted Zn-dependent protease
MKKKPKIKMLMLIALGLALIGFSCAYDPVTGKNEFNVISDKDEVEIGSRADATIRQEFGVYQDSNLSAYINEVGQSLVAISDRPNLQYYFTILDSPVINAFALPGGYVYVTRGILAQVNSQAELAMILGHELSHITARHGAKRLSQLYGYQIAAMGASLIFQSQDFARLSQWVDLGVSLAMLGYGRDNEFEADQIGLRYAFKDGYQPQASYTFLKTLKKQEKHESNFLSNFLSTHPPTSERIERSEKLANDLNSSGNARDLAVGINTYKLKISGLVLGPHRQNGLVSENVYFNYFYGIKLKRPDPEKYELQSPTQKSVTSFVAKDKQAQFYLEGTTNQFKTSLEFAQSSEKNSDQKIISLKSQWLRGFNITTLLAQSVDDNNQILFIKKVYLLKDTNALRFTFAAPEAVKTSYLADFESFLQSLEPLTAAEKVSDTALRLKIHTVVKGDTLEKIALRYLGDTQKSEKVASFNGWEPGYRPQVGDLVKIPPDLKN